VPILIAMNTNTLKIIRVTLFYLLVAVTLPITIALCIQILKYGLPVLFILTLTAGLYMTLRS